MQLILFIKICRSSLLYKDSDSVVCVSVHARVNFQKKDFRQMVKTNLIIDFYMTLPIRDEQMMGVGAGDKLINQRSRLKCEHCF